MAWRFHGRAKIDPDSPNATAVCDRCSIWYNLVDLQYQYEWFGPNLANTRFRVCPTCMDKPFEQNRPLVLPPDPVPVIDPRVEAFSIDQYGPVPTNWDANPNNQYDEINTNNSWDQ